MKRTALPRRAGHRQFLKILILPLLLLGAQSQGQPFWPQFRGPNGQGISQTARPPINFSKSNAQWSAMVPPGHSSPAIWGNKIFLTSCESSKLECRAYDRTNGKLLWAKSVVAEKLETTHPFNNTAAPTPAVDADRAIFYFGSYGLAAFAHDGTAAWKKKLPMQVSRGNYGSSSSPILWGDLVVLALDTDKEGSRLLALKRATGEVAWETERPMFKAGWSTPIVWNKDGHSEIVLLGSTRLVAYNPADGKELWSVPGFTIETATSPACDESHIFACSAGIGGRSSLHFDASFWAQLLKFDTNHDGKIQIDEVPSDFRFVQRPELPEGHPGRLFPFEV